MAFEERLSHAEEEGVCARRQSDERAAEVEALKAQVGRAFQWGYSTFSHMEEHHNLGHVFGHVDPVFFVMRCLTRRDERNLQIAPGKRCLREARVMQVPRGRQT